MEAGVAEKEASSRSQLLAFFSHPQVCNPAPRLYHVPQGAYGACGANHSTPSAPPRPRPVLSPYNGFVTPSQPAGPYLFAPGGMAPAPTLVVSAPPPLPGDWAPPRQAPCAVAQSGATEAAGLVYNAPSPSFAVASASSSGSAVGIATPVRRMPPLPRAPPTRAHYVPQAAGHQHQAPAAAAAHVLAFDALSATVAARPLPATLAPPMPRVQSFANHVQVAAGGGAYPGGRCAVAMSVACASRAGPRPCPCPAACPAACASPCPRPRSPTASAAPTRWLHQACHQAAPTFVPRAQSFAVPVQAQHVAVPVQRGFANAQSFAVGPGPMVQPGIHRVQTFALTAAPQASARTAAQPGGVQWSSFCVPPHLCGTHEVDRRVAAMRRAVAGVVP